MCAHVQAAASHHTPAPCREVDDGSGDVSVEEFCKLISKLGVTANMAEAQGLFRRFGYESVMPFNKWASTLVNQPSRQLQDDMAGGRDDRRMLSSSMLPCSMQCDQTGAVPALHALEPQLCQAAP